MVTIAELIGSKAEEELKEKFVLVKPGFSAEKCHVKFKVIETGVTVTLPSGQKVMATIKDGSNMYFLEFPKDVPEGYKRRAIDAWDKVLVSKGVRPKRKAWKDKYHKKKRGKRRKKTKPVLQQPKPAGGKS